MSCLNGISTVCHSVLIFEPLLATINVSKFWDGIVQFRHAGLKGLICHRFVGSWSGWQCWSRSVWMFPGLTYSHRRSLLKQKQNESTLYCWEICKRNTVKVLLRYRTLFYNIDSLKSAESYEEKNNCVTLCYMHGWSPRLPCTFTQSAPRHICHRYIPHSIWSNSASDDSVNKRRGYTW